MSDIIKMSDQFKDFASLKAFADSQYKLIVSLSTKVNQLEQERDHLKKLLEQSVPIIKTEEQKAAEALIVNLTDEETICRTQLKILRDIALERELTLEECKKTEVYNKILTIINSKGKGIGSGNEKLPDAELLSLIDGGK